MNASVLIKVATGFVVLALAGTTVWADGPTPEPATPAATAVSAAPAAAPETPRPPPAPGADPVTLLSDTQKDWYIKIRQVANTALSSASMDEFRAGEKQILDIKAPEALEPMALALYTRNTRWRSTFIQAAEQFAKGGVAPINKLAVIYLEDMAVKDPSGVLRGKARSDLLAKDTPRETTRLKYQLAASHDAEVRGRAAELLARLKDQTAVANLIEALSTVETRLNGYTIDSRSVQMDVRTAIAQGSLRPFQVTGVAVSANQQAIGNMELPTVHISELHTTVGMGGGMTMTPDYERVTTNHPEILMALKSLTGKDFGYDQAAWMNWLKANSGLRDEGRTTPSANWGN